jgi:hypothetical protein
MAAAIARCAAYAASAMAGWKGYGGVGTCMEGMYGSAIIGMRPMGPMGSIGPMCIGAYGGGLIADADASPCPTICCCLSYMSSLARAALARTRWLRRRADRECPCPVLALVSFPSSVLSLATVLPRLVVRSSFSELVENPLVVRSSESVGSSDRLESVAASGGSSGEPSADAVGWAAPSAGTHSGGSCIGTCDAGGSSSACGFVTGVSRGGRGCCERGGGACEASDEDGSGDECGHIV